jgi:ribosomal protein S18 acetylase RimI-like enzyme
MAPRIRTASEADLPQVAAIHVTSWQDAFSGVVPDAVLGGMSVEGSLERWVQHLAAGPFNLAVAIADDSEIAGFCYASAIADDDRNRPYRFRVFALHTRPTLRGHGIGAALLHDAFHRAVHRKGLDAAIL